MVFLSLDKEQQAKFHSHWWEEHIGIRKLTKFKSDTSKTSEALLHNARLCKAISSLVFNMQITFNFWNFTDFKTFFPALVFANCSQSKVEKTM